MAWRRGSDEDEVKSRKVAATNASALVHFRRTLTASYHVLPGTPA